MLLDFIELKKNHFTSSAVRFSYFFKNKFSFLKKYKKLSLKKKWNAGKNDNGQIIVRTKASLLKIQKHISINYSYRYVKISVISNFQFIPFHNKLLTLLLFSNGAAMYINTTEKTLIFSYFFFFISKKLKILKYKNILFMLFQIPKSSFVSLIELYPGRNAQYVRSSGCKAKIIKIDDKTHTALLELPSGIKKIFSYYSLVFLAKISLTLKKIYTTNKAGYWRSFGSKSIVRGVAKNPVDHPHGGRTKSVKYQRTPWGKTTKFK